MSERDALSRMTSSKVRLFTAVSRKVVGTKLVSMDTSRELVYFLFILTGRSKVLFVTGIFQTSTCNSERKATEKLCGLMTGKSSFSLLILRVQKYKFTDFLYTDM